MNTKSMLFLSAVAVASAASADVMDRPQGIKIGERMTLRPYVALSYTYDSNVDSTKHSKAGSQWLVRPGASFDYVDENWSLVGSAYYEYHAYEHYSHQLNQSSFGETLNFNWANARADEKGWRVKFSETFRQIAQDDDMSNSGGRGIGRDRKEFKADGIIERRLNAYWRAAAIGDYYLLDYDNDVEKYANLYGWKRAVAGGEIGYAPTKWTDLILQANYQWYWQDNGGTYYNRSIRSNSKGWSVLAGLGSHATEKITYRVLGGWSHFEYAEGVKDCDGFTYQVSANWKVDHTLSLMLLGSSYYQPSEHEYGSAIKVNSLSIGIAKSFVRGKVNGTLDLAYRNEHHVYTMYGDNDYDQNIYTARIGVNYVLNRFFSLFGRVEYQTCDTSGESIGGHYYDYDRFRGTVGVRMTY